MKTFLWTTLFWIVAGIALLLCLWFGNLGTQVLDNGWLAKIMPKNLQTKFCDCDSVITSTLESIDRCAAAELNNCNPEVLDVEEDVGLTWESDTTRLQQPLADIMENQEIIYNYLQDSFASINQSIADIEINSCTPQQGEEPVIDEREQQRLQLQAQIDALQEEMANL